ncbi:MAG: phenylalanine--tRNA ligase subunit beta [Anaerolineae bacterium]
MKVVMSWLEDYVDVSGVSVGELAERWTLAGLEVERIERVGDWWDRERLVVGNVVRVEPHPNADRLVLAQVDYGADAPHRVVTGAPNLLELRTAGDLEEPMRVALAFEGVELFDGHKDGWEKMTLKGREVRGVMSDAMVCSEKEIGLSDDHSGILVLDRDAPIGKPLTDVLGDAVIEIDITPNFAHAMSMVGVARETAAILGRPFSAPQPRVATSGGSAADMVGVVIEDPDLCPRYSARLISDVEVRPSPHWMARRLTLAGMRPINNIVDVTNYTMLEWGEPLHAFDYERLVERAEGGRPTITVRRAREGERMTTLDDVDRVLDGETLLICDGAGPIAIGGVMGGADSEVSANTTSVLLEAAAFDFINIARTSRLLRIPSESAARFGRGVHPELAEPASVRAAGMLAECASGAVLDGVVDEYPRPFPPVTITLPAGEIKRVLGVDIPTAEAERTLRSLEFETTLAAGELRATVPPHRLDCSLPADLLEEIARIHGYDRLPSTLMADPLPPQRDNERLALEETARNALVLGGLQELVNYRLVSRESEAKTAVEPFDAAGYVVLANPISPERSVMRQSLLTGLLSAAENNLRFTDRVALFEVGPVFQARGDWLPDEPRRVAAVMTGPSVPHDWCGAGDRDIGFYDAKGAVETLLGSLGLTAGWVPAEHPSMHPGRTAAVLLDDTDIGRVGELHPAVRAQWDLGDRPVAVVDLSLDALQAILAGASRQFQPISAFPAVTQDLAVVVDEGVSAADIAAVMRDAAGPLLVDLELFDVFRGSQLGDDLKSMAWTMRFQARDKTLRSKQVDKLREKIVTALSDKLGAKLR